MAKAKGSPKTGGRKKGSRNKISKPTLDVRARIEKEADPIGFMIDVARCKEFTVGAPNNPMVKVPWHPTCDHMMAAHKWRGNKLIADLRAVEVSGPEGGDIIVKVVRFGDGN